MTKFIERNPLWAFVILIAAAAALWLIFATWPQGFEDVFGKKKVSSGSILVPDSPYFIGLFLCEHGRTDHPYTGRFFKAGGRYVCVSHAKVGEKVISEFDLGKAAEAYFKLHEVPPISGFAIAIDTDNAKGGATAKSWVRKIEYLQ